MKSIAVLRYVNRQCAKKETVKSGDADMFSLCNLCWNVVVNKHHDLQSAIITWVTASSQKENNNISRQPLNSLVATNNMNLFISGNWKRFILSLYYVSLWYLYTSFCHVMYFHAKSQHWHDLTWWATSSRQYLPVSSSPADWGIVCWLICFRAPPPGFAWCRWLGWPGWSRCRGRGRRRRLPPTPAQGGGAAVAAGPIERGRGKGREGRSAWRCAWQLGHDPAL